MSVAMNAAKDVCCIHKSGSAVLSVALLGELIGLVESRVADVVAVFRNFLNSEEIMASGIDVYKEENLFAGRKVE